MTSFVRAGALVALLAVVGCSGDDLSTDGGAGSGGASSGAGGVSGSSGQSGQGGDTSAAGTTSAGTGGVAGSDGGAGSDSTAGTGGVAGSDGGAGSAGSGGSMVEPAGGAGGGAGSSGQGGSGPVGCECPSGDVVGLPAGACKMPPGWEIKSPEDSKAKSAVDGSGSSRWDGGEPLDVKLAQAQSMRSVTVWAFLSSGPPPGPSGLGVSAVLEIQDEDGTKSQYAMDVPGVGKDANDTPITFVFTEMHSVRRLSVTLKSTLTGSTTLTKIGITEVTFHVCQGSSSSN